MKYSVAYIKANNEDISPFFSKDTMKFFGDKLSSFDTIEKDGRTFLYRKPSATVTIFNSDRIKAGRTYFNVWEYDPKTHELLHTNKELEEEIYSLI